VKLNLLDDALNLAFDRLNLTFSIENLQVLCHICQGRSGHLPENLSKFAA